MSFLEHLEELRWHILRSAVVITLFSVVCLFFKEFIFDHIIFAAKSDSFPTYKFFCWCGDKLHLSGICIQGIDYTLINGDMTLPFLLWFKTSFAIGLILAFPYILWEIWRFVRPALYQNEKKNAGRLVFLGVLLFYVGSAFGYYLLAPFSINFLGSFTLGSEVENTFTVSSYINVLTGMVFWSGVIFEIPMLAYFLASLGLLENKFLVRNRKYAIVVALILAAVITPSGDAFSLSLVTMPLILLYEVSIWIVRRTEKKRRREIFDEE